MRRTGADAKRRRESPGAGRSGDAARDTHGHRGGGDRGQPVLDRGGEFREVREGGAGLGGEILGQGRFEPVLIWILRDIEVGLTQGR